MHRLAWCACLMMLPLLPLPTRAAESTPSAAEEEVPAAKLVSLGRLVSHDVLPDRIVLHGEHGDVIVRHRLDGVVRVDFVNDGHEPPETSWSVTRSDWSSKPIQVIGGNPLTLDGTGWRIMVGRDPLTLTFLDGEGKVRLRKAGNSVIEATGVARRAVFELADGEAIYGMGHHDLKPADVKLNRRGHTFRIENRHGPAVMMFPFWVSTENYGVFIDNPGLATMDVGDTKNDMLEYRSEIGELTYYVFLGDSMAQVLDRFTQVTGRPALAPRWTLGNMQSRFGFNSFADLNEIIDGFAERQIPLECMVMDLDWFGREAMGNLEFQDTPDWPSPKRSIAAIHRKGIKLIPITEPLVTSFSENVTDVLAKGLLGRHKDSEMAYGVAVNWLTNKAPTYILDFTRAETRAWWSERHRRMIRDYKFDGFWQDLNEPEGVKPDMMFAGGPAPAVQNVMAMEMNRALAEAIEEHRPGARPFILSRSGFVGMQKYGAGVWSGDVAAQWFDLQRQPSVALSMSMSGVAYWNSDVGGYGGESSPELYTRWCQFAFFNPIYRPHAAFKAREPWAFGPEVEAAVKKLLLLRSRLIPYYYTTAREAYDTGMPMMRPLVLEWPNDPAVRDLDDQFMYGPSLMAAPVLEEGATSRKIHLPEGTWYNWFTGERYTGGQSITMATPLSEFPLLVRAPAIIPMGPEMLRTDERPLDVVTLRVYLPPGAVRAEGELYEDDGLTRGYETAQMARTKFLAERRDNSVTILLAGPLIGDWKPVSRRAWEVEFHDVDRPSEVVVESKQGKWSYDEAARVLTVSVKKRSLDKRSFVEVKW